MSVREFFDADFDRMIIGIPEPGRGPTSGP